MLTALKRGPQPMRQSLRAKTAAWDAVVSSDVAKTGPYSTSSSVHADQHANVAEATVKPFSEMPSPKGVPFFGTIFQYPRETNKQRAVLLERCNQYFPIYKEKFMGLELVVLYDVGEIERLFKTEPKYPKRFHMALWNHYHELAREPEGILISEDETWHRMRRVVDKPMLRIKDVAGYADDVNEVITDFLPRLEKIRKPDGLVPDLERELFNWSLESICKILYEKRFGGLTENRSEEMQEFIDAVREMFSTTAKLLVYPVWFCRTVLRPIYNRHNNSWDTIFRVGKKCVNEKMNELATQTEENDDGKAGVLSYLLSEKSLPVGEIYSNIIELMMGAVDTTSTVMLWMFQELALHPEVQDKLFAEVKSVLPDGRQPSYKDLQNMPYHKAVIKETLRKYPVAGGTARILHEDRLICGYRVPANTSVLIQGHILTRLPQYFDEPEVFRPERWLRGTGEKPNPYTHIAFGFGTRMCIGRRVAELEMNMLLSRLIQKFSIEAGFTEPAVEALELVIKPDRPIKIKLKDRQHV